MGPLACVPFADGLLHALGDEDADVRHAAVASLRDLGADAEKFAPHVLPALDDAKYWVREAAARVLADILGRDVPEPAKYVATLGARLADPIWGVREACAHTLLSLCAHGETFLAPIKQLSLGTNAFPGLRAGHSLFYDLFALRALRIGGSTFEAYRRMGGSARRSRKTIAAQREPALMKALQAWERSETIFADAVSRTLAPRLGRDCANRVIEAVLGQA